VTEPVLLDTGPLVAILLATDQHHERCVEAFQKLTRPPVTCVPVLTEAAWLIRADIDNVRKLMSYWRNGVFLVEALEVDAASWIDSFLARFADQNPQLADAALMYLADRDHFDTVFTLDHRDFSVYRTNDNRGLEIIPE
jgi:predicted nucleic acid-binding protein